MTPEGTEPHTAGPTVIQWCAGSSCCDPLWEQAYEDFETPQEEVRKFMRRHRRLGVDRWPHEWQVVELFCGRGNGLVALKRLGFDHVEGVDLSPRLLAQYRGDEQLYVGDCRTLQFRDASKDAVIVQGGLHHLPQLPADMDAVLAEIQRILRPRGRVVIVEPWLTPFLRIVHLACALRPLRWSWRKLDAVARMNEREWTTYERWLARPAMVLESLQKAFQTRVLRRAWGKLMFVGEKRQ